MVKSLIDRSTGEASVATTGISVFSAVALLSLLITGISGMSGLLTRAVKYIPAAKSITKAAAAAKTTGALKVNRFSMIFSLTVKPTL